MWTPPRYSDLWGQTFALTLTLFADGATARALQSLFLTSSRSARPSLGPGGCSVRKHLGISGTHPHSVSWERSESFNPLTSPYVSGEPPLVNGLLPPLQEEGGGAIQQHHLALKTSCVRSRSVRNQYYDFKLIENSTATLLKKIGQNNDTKKLELVKSCFSGKNFSTFVESLICRVIFSSVVVLFSFNFKPLPIIKESDTYF